MGQLVQPKVYLVGFTEAYEPGIKEYLQDSDQAEFWRDWEEARAQGISSGECLCSLSAKLCYKTLVPHRNPNVEKTRDIASNLRSCYNTGHLAITEHCSMSFLVTNCSRIYTHEQVRHRLASYSQTSGRYCRLESIDLVWDPILDPVKEEYLAGVGMIEDKVYLAECKLGLRKPPPGYPDVEANSCLVLGPIDARESERRRWVPDMSFDMNKRKAITSALRRLAPNGQSNEILMSFNVRTLRHEVMVRTSRFAEQEIRNVFNQVYHLTKDKFPLAYHGARTREYNGLLEIFGMRAQPYDLVPGDKAALQYLRSEDMQEELDRRALAT